MTQQIQYDPVTKPTGADVRRWVNKVLDALADGRRLKGKLDFISYGSDWHQLALELGSPDPAVMSSTDAQDAWTLVSNALTAIDVAAVTSLSRLDRG